MPKADAKILLDAFNLPPAEAIEFFRRKGYTISFDWWETWQEAHARAFTVAKAMRLDILRDIREAVDQALAEGKTFREFKKELEPKLRAKGWWGRQKIIDPKTGEEVEAWLGTPWRLKTIFRTNLQSAYMAGRYKQMLEVADDRPYWRYLAVLDSKTRPSHRALHGKIFRYDDPFWKTHYPPNGWNCRCHVQSLSERQLKAWGLEDRVESSEGKLKEDWALVSEKTGEMRPVTVYRDRNIVMAPDPGFSYNPGLAAWQPNLDRYPYDVAKKYLEGAVTGPDFTRFFEGKAGGTFPVAVLNEGFRKAIKAESQTVLLSEETLAKNKARHPELEVRDYQMLPDVIDRAHLVIQDGERTLVFYQAGDKIYYAVVKSTKSGRALFLTSFRLASHTDVEKLKQKGKVLKDEL